MLRSDPQHPGFDVSQQCLVQHELGVVDAARMLGVSRHALSNLLTGRAGIFPEMAVRLAKAFAQSEEDWLRLQFTYELAQVRKRAHTIQASPVSGQSKVSADTQPKLL